MYQALYRKWRPKTFEDVSGQSHITDTLRRQVAEGKISHAYLFTGTRGTGKTTCAKILAKAVNCLDPQNGDPCCRCANCLGIENGSYTDVTELDAASNNGVDQVRALREEAIYAPAHGSKRVYIVDEVHMLSVPAFNALLKILEEPPEHLVFILATTELHKVPATILSRCQRYAFKRITPQDIVERLQYVAGQEGIELTEDGAVLLARLADGALRDGLSLLDQCAAAGGRVDSGAVLEVLGLAGGLQTAELLEHVLRRDAPAALSMLDGLYQGGKDVAAVLGELSVLVRDLLLRQTAPKQGDVLLSGTYDDITLNRLAPLAKGTRLFYLSTTLQKTLAELYYSTERRIDAELCLLRMCDESLSGDLTALERRIARMEETLSSGHLPAPSPAAAPAAPKTEAPARPAPLPVAAAQEASPPPKPVPQAEPEEERPPLPEEPPVPEERGERVYDIPEEVPAQVHAVPVSQPERAAAEGGTAPAAEAGAGTSSRAIPASPAPTQGSPPAALDISWWRGVVERCKGRLSPMYRAFLDMCAGVLEGELLTVYAPDQVTLGRLDNDRVRGVLLEEAGGASRMVLQVGQPPQGSAEENFKNLVAFGSQFDNITIKD